jgi:hypothetical protein
MSSIAIFLVGLLAANLCVAFAVLTVRELSGAVRSVPLTARDPRRERDAGE